MVEYTSETHRCRIFLCWENFDSISLVVIGLLRFSISLWFTLDRFCVSSNLSISWTLSNFWHAIDCSIFLIYWFLKEGGKGTGKERETLMCCSTRLGIHRLILVCALSRDQTCNPEYQDDALTNWTTQPRCSSFSNFLKKFSVTLNIHYYISFKCTPKRLDIT